MPITRFPFPVSVNESESPLKLKATDADKLVNFMPGRPQDGWVRGRITDSTDDVTTTTQTADLITFTEPDGDDVVHIGLDTAEAGAFVRGIAPNDAGIVYNVSLVNENQPTGSCGYARLGDYVYFRADHGNVVRWSDGDVYTRLTNSPEHCDFVYSYLNRLFVLGGAAPPGGGIVYHARLYWSDDGGPTADTLAMWQDNATGLTNQIVIAQESVGGVD